MLGNTQAVLLGVRRGAANTYATLNPLDKNADLTLSNGDLTVTRVGSGNAWVSVRATIGVSSGKWYWEVTVDANGKPAAPTDGLDVGVCNSSSPLSNFIGSDANGWGYFFNGTKYHSGSPTGGLAAFTVNDVIGVALDMDTGEVWWSKNGVWVEGDPAAGTGASYTGITGTIFPGLSSFYKDEQNTANFGASSFSYSVPSGFNSGVYT